MHLVEKGDCHRDETLKRLQLSYFIIPQSAVWGLVEFTGKRLNQILMVTKNYGIVSYHAKTIKLAALIRDQALSLKT